MKEVKIKFCGMGPEYDTPNNFIYEILSKRYKVKLSDNPDYIFYQFGAKDFLDYDCVRIFYTAENIVPDFNLCDYGISYQYIDFGDRYFRYPVYFVNSFKPYKGDDYATNLFLAMNKHLNAQKYLPDKKEFCSFVYSNEKGAECRKKIFECLSSYKKVNSGGRYLNNIGGAVEDKLVFQRKHKFSIAFENSSSSGYTTEKIVHAFAAGTIPIYWGNPDIEKEFNPESFINCNAFGLTEKGEPEILEKILCRIIEIDENDDLFYSMLKSPAFVCDDIAQKQEENLEKFLFNIFDQKKENAFRRNRVYYGARYEKRQKLGLKVFNILESLQNIMNKIIK